MRVGIATVDITPDRPVWLDGFAGRTRPSEGIDLRLEASAVVLDNGTVTLAILAADILAVDDYLLPALRQAAAALGIPPANLMVNTSHTHSGPIATRVRGFCFNYDEAYQEELKRKVMGVLAAAAADRREASLDYIVGSSTMGINRRRETAAGVPQILPTPHKAIDADVPVLRVLDGEGKERAAIFGYACHPATTAAYTLGSEFPGHARALVAEKTPGCTPVFLQGCGADVMPRHITAERAFGFGPDAPIAELGHELGRAVVAALCGNPQRLGEELGARSEVVRLRFDHQPTEAEIAAAEASSGITPQTWARAVRQALARDGKLEDELPIEVQVFNVGGLVMIGIAAEVCAATGLRLRAEMPGRMVWPMGYCNGCWDYIAPPAEYPGGGYEVVTSHMDSVGPFPKPLGLAIEAEDTVVNKAVELTHALSACCAADRLRCAPRG